MLADLAESLRHRGRVDEPGDLVPFGMEVPHRRDELVEAHPELFEFLGAVHASTIG